MEKQNNSLSLSRFKNDGVLVDPSTLSEDDYAEFVLAKLMKSILDTVQVAIPTESQFKRARFAVMSAFHKAFGELSKKDEM